MNAVAKIDDEFVAASGAEIAEHLHLLFSAMPMQAGSDPKTALAGYLVALQGRPAWAVEEAVKRFLRGEVEGASKKFCPRPPELAEVVSAVLAPLAEERVDAARKEAEAKRIREMMAERNQFTDEHREKMRFMFAVLQAGLSLKQVDRVAAATARGIGTKAGIEEMMALGQEWGVSIPESLWRAIGAGHA